MPVAQSVLGGGAAAEGSCMPAQLPELNQGFSHERTRRVQTPCPRSGMGSAWGAMFYWLLLSLQGCLGQQRLPFGGTL